MGDFLGIVVKGDLLSTFVNMFEIIVCLDLFASVCMIFGSMGRGLSE